MNDEAQEAYYDLVIAPYEREQYENDLEDSEAHDDS